MKTGTLLDTDMTTLARLIGDGARWWVDELSAMMPGLAARKRRPISGLIASYGSDGAIRLDGEPVALGAADAGERPRAATLLIPAQMALRRTVALPPMRQADLRKLVRLDLDRLMPFDADAAYSDVVAIEGSAEAEIAAIPKAQLQAVHAAAVAAGLAPTAIGMADDDGSRRFDFLPGLAEDGLIEAPRSGATFWWSLVALLFLINVGAMIFRDTQRVSQLAAQVESQQPTADAARRLARRIADEEGLRAELLARRERDNALGALAFVTRAVPAGVWIQRYSWNGQTLRLSGYKQDNVDVVAALRRSGRFASVRASTSDVAAESATGQPFDVTAEWGKGAAR